MQTDNESLLNDAKQYGYEYPKFLVWLKFSLLGGMISGFLMIIVILIMEIFDNSPLPPLIGTVFGFTILGGVFGFVPATLMGLYASLSKMTLIKFIDYLHLYLVGTIISAIYFSFWGNTSDDLKSYLALWAIGSIGGVSAMICGKLFLPKLSKDFNQKEM